MKPYFSRIVPSREEDNSLLSDIEKTRCALETAYMGFDNATDPDLIDCYIYEMNAVQKRYKYLLQEAAKHNAAIQDSAAPSLQQRLSYEKSPIPLVNQTFREFPFSVG